MRSASRAVLAAFIAALAGCTDAREATNNSSRPANASVASAASIVSREEPWTFGSSRGRVITTPCYRIFTTLEYGFIANRAPAFMENALARYRSAFTPLAAPVNPLDSYLLAHRSQWSRAAAQVLGPAGTPYQQILRGGITAGGRSILYDIGPADTFSLLAHEGWHQFTQSTFKEPLPIWLEEGIATVMEGFRWNADDPSTPEFRPWCNLERFDQLRNTLAQGEFRPLQAILSSSPTRSLDGGTSDALSYYAQVWALALYLMEGEEGTLAPNLQRLIRDAANGSMWRRVAEAAHGDGDRFMALPASSSAVFQVYFGRSPASADRGYGSFCHALTVPGSREAIVVGNSPLRRDR